MSTINKSQLESLSIKIASCLLEENIISDEMLSQEDADKQFDKTVAVIENELRQYFDARDAERLKQIELAFATFHNNDEVWS